MKYSTLFLFALVFLSCVERKAEQATSATAEVVSDTRSKLERFLNNPTDSVYQHVDLSGDSIRQMPDLSAYTIESLDLSNNQIDSLIELNLPRKLQKLNLSYNRLHWRVEVKQIGLCEINVSHNTIRFFVFRPPIERAIATNNGMWGIHFDQAEQLQYLDVSNNPQMDHEMMFDHTVIDTIVRHNTAGGKPFERFELPPLGSHRLR